MQRLSSKRAGNLYFESDLFALTHFKFEISTQGMKETGNDDRVSWGSEIKYFATPPKKLRFNNV